MTALREEVQRAIRAFIAAQPEDAQRLPAIQFVHNLDDLLADAVIPIILGRAAEVCATLAETTYDDADGFQAALGCEAAIRQIGRGE